MAVRPKRSIAEQMNAAQVAIQNTLADAEIQAAVAGYGYSAAKLSEGQQLYEAAQAAVNAQVAAAGAQQQATERMKEAEKAAREAYQALAKIARASLSPAQLTMLGLTGPMPRPIAAFLNAAATLFTNASQVSELAGFGYDQARLLSERAKITACDEANRAQEAAKGAAQQATQEQNAALKALERWVAQYLKIARVALRGKPQLLEKLGVTVR